MARARNIKPGFFKNEDLAECSPWARLCFAGLWTLADREGRLEDRGKRIKGELFAFDTIDVEPLLTELATYGFITRYAAEGRVLIQINEFAKHQHPHHKEPESEFPAPQSPGLLLVATTPKPEALPPLHEPKVPDKPGISTSTGAIPSITNPADAPDDPDALDSGALIPEGREGPLAPSAQRAPPPPFDGSNTDAIPERALIPLALGFDLPEDWGLDAEALGWSRQGVLTESEKFRQYWTRGKGAGKRRNRKGWRQSWSNWLGRAAEKVA